MNGEGLDVGFWARSSPPPFQFHLDRRSSQTGGSVYVYPCACTAAVVVVFAIVAGIVHLPVGGSCALPLGVQCRDRSCGSMCSTMNIWKCFLMKNVLKNITYLNSKKKTFKKRD